VNVVQKGNPFSGPIRPRPVREAFSRRANHQFILVVLILGILTIIVSSLFFYTQIFNWIPLTVNSSQPF